MNRPPPRGPVHNYSPGTRYGRLVLLSYTPGVAGRPAQVEARCDCGVVRTIRWPVNIVRGHVTSCGCQARDNNAERAHGMVGTRTYVAWFNMVQRCTNPNATSYRYYGEKGVKIAARWRDFRKFLADMGECPSKDHTIDRRNPFRGYSRDNCRWLPRKEQARTRRNTFSKRKGATE